MVPFSFLYFFLLEHLGIMDTSYVISVYDYLTKRVYIINGIIITTRYNTENIFWPIMSDSQTCLKVNY